jgi:hypothetical protein
MAVSDAYSTDQPSTGSTGSGDSHSLPRHSRCNNTGQRLADDRIQLGCPKARWVKVRQELGVHNPWLPDRLIGQWTYIRHMNTGTGPAIIHRGRHHRNSAQPVLQRGQRSRLQVALDVPTVGLLLGVKSRRLRGLAAAARGTDARHGRLVVEICRQSRSRRGRLGPGCVMYSGRLMTCQKNLVRQRWNAQSGSHVDNRGPVPHSHTGTLLARGRTLPSRRKAHNI